MNFYDIDNLQRDPKQDNLYNLFTSTFKENAPGGLSFERYTVTEEQSMRLDLVSQTVYQSLDFVDLLCNVNRIDNPLNIMESDQLLVLQIGQASFVQVTEISNIPDLRIVQDAEKTSKVDPNRQKYVEQNYSLSPTTIEYPQDPVKIVKNQIVIE